MSTPPARCGDRSGFLFAHDCDRPPVTTCSRCGMPICAQHARRAPAGAVCIACLRRRDDDSGTDRSSSSDTRSSDSSSSVAPAAAVAAGLAAGGAFGGAGASADWGGPDEPAAGDDPYFQGTEAERAAYYDADDFRAFDAAPAAADAGTADAGEAPETDTGAS